MTSHPENWTSQGLLAHIRRLHELHPDHRFTFILGAGASVSSGIPAGKELVDGWLRELHERWCNDERVVEDWVNAETLGIKDFDFAKRAEFYPQVFSKRFNKGHEKEGYETLGRLMDRAEPSFGYSVLAQIMATTRHNVVVTTNFDNLVADAMAIYAGKHPLMVGHESLAGYARARLSRPLVAKIHRDLFIDPINDPCGTATLANGWDIALNELFKQCTPIVIGYGGNDGSLMGFLERLPERHLPGGLIWTYRKRSGPPSARIASIVARHGGALVPILGFDEFMLELREPLGLPDLSEQIASRARELPQRYRTRRDELLERISDDQETARQRGGVVDAEQQAVWEAAGSLADQEQSWWTWELRADSAKDPAEREAIYREGLRRLPDSSELHENFAIFTAKVLNDDDEAERLFLRASELDPHDARYFANFALFMRNHRRDYFLADQLYRRALELDSKSASIATSFANFLGFDCKNNDEAERLYRRALELDPGDAKAAGNFATFMWTIGKEYDEAERLYRRSLALDSSNANIAVDFATFMSTVRKEHDEAERFYLRALGLDPGNAMAIGRFATFMWIVRKDPDESERLYRQALELDPGDAMASGNFATFIWSVRKDHDEAARLYRRALELDPDNVIAAGNFAGFMLAHRDVAESEALAREALRTHAGSEDQLAAELNFYLGLAARLQGRDDRSALKNLHRLLTVGFKREPWTFEDQLQRAEQSLVDDELRFYRSLAAAILDPAALPGLAEMPRWQAIAAASGTSELA